MINEKDTIRCESIFNDDRTHRFLWKRVWDSKDKPIACVIMLNPCIADNIITDITTGLVCNNVARLEKEEEIEEASEAIDKEIAESAPVEAKAPEKEALSDEDESV